MLNFSIPSGSEKTDLVMSLDDGHIRVSFVNLGEGYCDDYDPENMEDENLLRYDVELNTSNDKSSLLIERALIESCDEDGWGTVSGASFCTMVPAETEKSVLGKLLLVIHHKLCGPLSEGMYPKPLMEELSWICPADVKEGGKYAPMMM